MIDIRVLSAQPDIVTAKPPYKNVVCQDIRIHNNGVSPSWIEKTILTRKQRGKICSVYINKVLIAYSGVPIEYNNNH